MDYGRLGMGKARRSSNLCASAKRAMVYSIDTDKTGAARMVWRFKRQKTFGARVGRRSADADFYRRRSGMHSA